MNLIWAPAQLAMLAKVVDLNGFSAAARALGVPKAAVSRAVADLEKSPRRARAGAHHAPRRAHRGGAPGVSACEARGRGIRRGAHGAHRDCTRRKGGPLRVAADPTYGRVLLSPLVPRFLEAFAHVPLEVALDAHQLAEGAWDVAIRTRPPADASLTQRLLGAPPALLCATPAYLQQRGSPSARMTCAATIC